MGGSWKMIPFGGDGGDMPPELKMKLDLISKILNGAPPVGDIQKRKTYMQDVESLINLPILDAFQKIWDDGHIARTTYDQVIAKVKEDLAKKPDNEPFLKGAMINSILEQVGFPGNEGMLIAAVPVLISMADDYSVKEKLGVLRPNILESDNKDVKRSIALLERAGAGGEDKIKIANEAIKLAMEELEASEYLENQLK